MICLNLYKFFSTKGFCIAACMLFIILLYIPSCYVFQQQSMSRCHTVPPSQLVLSSPFATPSGCSWQNFALLTECWPVFHPRFSPTPATPPHTLSRSDSTQIPTHKYTCAIPSDIMNYFCSPHRDSKNGLSMRFSGRGCSQTPGSKNKKSVK